MFLKAKCGLIFAKDYICMKVKIEKLKHEDKTMYSKLPIKTMQIED
jgi:hypothetical protein